MKSIDPHTATTKLRRTKLFLVGEGRAGKTATCKSLLSQPFDPLEKSTIGCSSQNIRLDAQTAKNFQKVDQSRELARVLAAIAISSGKESRSERVTVDKLLKSAPSELAQVLKPAPKLAPKPMPASQPKAGFPHAVKLAEAAPKLKSPPPVSPRNPIAATGSAAPVTREPDILKQEQPEDNEDFGIRQMFDNLALPTTSDDNDSKDHILYSVWDFAGQSVFYDMLNLLMTRLVCI